MGRPKKDTANEKKEKISVLNKSAKVFEILPAPNSTKNRFLMPGRAAQIEADYATKLIEGYPHDLYDYDKEAGVSKGNAKLEKENKEQAAEIEELKRQLAEATALELSQE